MGDEFEEFCRRYDVYIRMIDSLTTKIRGFCYYSDGEFNVIINNKLCSKQQQETLLHELSHVIEDHFTLSQAETDMCEHQVKSMLKNIDELKRKYHCDKSQY